MTVETNKVENQTPLEVRLIRLLAKEGGILPKDISAELNEYLDCQFQCKRYLCIYYNTDTETHLEFNLLPASLHVPLKDPECQTCFRSAEKINENPDWEKKHNNCNSTRCIPPDIKFSNTEHDSSLLKRIVDRWEDHKDKIITDEDGKHRITNTDNIPFWFDYELFLHHKFDPFKNKSNAPKDASETDMFKILINQEEEDPFSSKTLYSKAQISYLMVQVITISISRHLIWKTIYQLVFMAVI